MKSNLLILATSLVALFYGNNACSQEGSSFRLGLQGGVSSPTGTYRNSIAGARNGYTFGISADYFFWGSKLGIGIDARSVGHPHQAPDTIVERNGFNTNTTANDYSSPMRFRHTSITLGPVYHLGEGRLGLDLYARGGMFFQQFPTYVQRETVKVYNDFTRTYTTFVFDRSAAQSRRGTSFTALMGARLGFAIFPNLEVFAYGDYQTGVGKKGSFTVEDLSGGEPPRGIPAQMLSFGGGLRLLFGDGRDPSSLSRNY